MTWRHFIGGEYNSYTPLEIKAIRYGLVKQRILGKFLKNAKYQLGHKAIDIRYAIDTTFPWGMTFEGHGFWSYHNRKLIENFRNYKSSLLKKPSIYKER